jgi:hypothetical protein
MSFDLIYANEKKGEVCVTEEDVDDHCHVEACILGYVGYNWEEREVLVKAGAVVERLDLIATMDVDREGDCVMIAYHMSEDMANEFSFMTYFKRFLVAALKRNSYLVNGAKDVKLFLSDCGASLDEIHDECACDVLDEPFKLPAAVPDVAVVARIAKCSKNDEMQRECYRVVRSILC